MPRALLRASSVSMNLFFFKLLLLIGLFGWASKVQMMAPMPQTNSLTSHDLLASTADLAGLLQLQFQARGSAALKSGDERHE